MSPTMKNVLIFRKKEIEPKEALGSAIHGLLYSSSNVALAIEERGERFVALDKAIVNDALRTQHDRPFDSVVGQDRERLYAKMSQVLRALFEYTKGVERGIKAAAALRADEVVIALKGRSPPVD
jgi:hypothetical protein